MKKRLGVIGAGSAGLISAGYFCTVLDNDWEIVLMHDPKLDSLGVGESTNGNFVKTIEEAMGFTFENGMVDLDATKKFGTKFINWRDKPFISPLIQGTAAVHFNTRKFKDYTLKKLPEMWPEKFKVLEGVVDDLQQNVNHAVVTIDHEQQVFDYVIDCRGFPKNFDDYTFSNCTLVNHCLVYDSPKFNPVEYTEHHATENGWMFGVPLQTRCSYGYLFNNEITSKEDALADFAKLMKVSKSKLDFREYEFKPYYAKKFLTNRILKNGNNAIFFEPISATSLFMYVRICDTFLKVITGEYTELDLNQIIRNDLEDLETVIRWYYHNGSIHDTEFWQKAKSQAIDQLMGDWKFEQLYSIYKTLVKEGRPYDDDGMIFSAKSWHTLDNIFGCRYFTENDFTFDIARVDQHRKMLEDRMSEELKNCELFTKNKKAFEKQGYVVVKNVLDELTVDLITHYALNDQLQNFNPENSQAQIPGTHSKYADPLMESLLAQMNPVMERATGLKLLPTYSYYRVYKPGDILHPHSDRDSCEISCTICFNFNYGEMQDTYNWPIFMGGTACDLSPGDIAVYRGCDILHWRDEFKAPEGSWHVQAFLHYVDANGSRAEWQFDKRPGLGFSQDYRENMIQANVKVQHTPTIETKSSGKKYITYTE